MSQLSEAPPGLWAGNLSNPQRLVVAAGNVFFVVVVCFMKSFTQML